MFKKGTQLFPDRSKFRQEDEAMGWASKRRRTNPRVNTNRKQNTNYDSSGSRNGTGGHSPSQKKSVRLRLEEPDGSVTVESPVPGSPATNSPSRRRTTIKGSV